jgi:hypothetical protein
MEAQSRRAWNQANRQLIRWNSFCLCSCADGESDNPKTAEGK